MDALVATQSVFGWRLRDSSERVAKKIWRRRREPSKAVAKKKFWSGPDESSEVFAKKKLGRALAYFRSDPVNSGRGGFEPSVKSGQIRSKPDTAALVFFAKEPAELAKTGRGGFGPSRKPGQFRPRGRMASRGWGDARSFWSGTIPDISGRGETRSFPVRTFSDNFGQLIERRSAKKFWRAEWEAVRRGLGARVQAVVREGLCGQRCGRPCSA